MFAELCSTAHWHPRKGKRRKQRYGLKPKRRSKHACHSSRSSSILSELAPTPSWPRACAKWLLANKM
eukprot:5247185-Amphidinium_carterae.1